MPAKGAEVTVSYTAWDTAAGGPKTGDGGNHTIKRIVDGAAAASITDTPTELENGEYEITLTAAENSGDAMSVQGASSTSRVVIIPTKWMNTDYSALADAILARAIDTAEATADKYCLAALVMFSMNFSIAGSTLSALKASDSTVFDTYTLNTTAGVAPVTGVSA